MIETLKIIAFMIIGYLFCKYQNTVIRDMNNNLYKQNKKLYKENQMLRFRKEMRDCIENSDN